MKNIGYRPPEFEVWFEEVKEEAIAIYGKSIELPAEMIGTLKSYHYQNLKPEEALKQAIIFMRNNDL